MASTQGLPLADRVDIHKSCKSLENLLSVFNDYCEAAGAVVSLQKKLAKALRETANLKVTNDIAANALNTSATLFETLSDIDAKYAKLVDKEYDSVSGEVKKWFKKLAKEEKAHDELLINANAKIKQAGQVYEKKSKKNVREAGEEHARYINLISTLGPEISQEKYSHALVVTQRHVMTTYSVAACVSRVADAEWVKSCEGVRRFSPTIGPLGEWRSLCEGGWMGTLPADLPGPEVQLPQIHPDPVPISPKRSERDERLGIHTVSEPLNQSGRSSTAAYELRDLTPPRMPAAQPYQRPTQYSNSPASDSLPPSSSDDPSRQFVDPATGSVRSLSAFPAPPTNFSLPHISPLRQKQASHTSSASSAGSQPVLKISDSQPSAPPVEEFIERPPIPNSEPILSPAEQKSNDATLSVSLQVTSSNNTSLDGSPRTDNKWQSTGTEPVSTRLTDSPSSTLSRSLTRTYGPKGDYLAEERDSLELNMPPIAELINAKPIDRSDTGMSNGSMVANMRSRYSYNSGTSSPPPKDIPRLPLSVTDLATKYTGNTSDEQQPTSPPRLRTSSPVSPRPMASMEQDLVSRSPRSPTPATDRLRLQRIEQMEKEQEQRARERYNELRARERDIELKAQELERQRASLMKTRNTEVPTPLSPVLRPRERKISFKYKQRSQSQIDLPMPSSVSPQVSTSTVASPYSRSSNSLDPPSPEQSGQGSDEIDYQRQPRISGEHAPYCACETCSATNYRIAAPEMMNHHIRPQANEKPKGWMRRLSMPVMGNAFSIDSKKNSTKNAMSLDHKKNNSTTLLRNGIVKDVTYGAPRRSYDSSVTGNRSVTSLGLKR